MICESGDPASARMPIRGQAAAEIRCRNSRATVGAECFSGLVNVGAYRHVLAIRDTRRILLLGFLVRVPMFAGTVILTLHVVTSLGRTYGQAGLVTAAATVAVAVCTGAPLATEPLQSLTVTCVSSPAAASPVPQS